MDLPRAIAARMYVNDSNRTVIRKVRKEIQPFALDRAFREHRHDLIRRVLHYHELNKEMFFRVNAGI